MLEFIFGRPKSGKTTEIINRIKECVAQNKKTYLLVPEQQVHVTETMLASMLPSSWKCFEVISFSRLCEMVFSRYGGLTRRSVDDNVKHLLMWHSVNSVSDMLEEYTQSKSDASFSDMLLSAITELSVLGVSPDKLEEAIERADDEQFKKKFSDIALIYANFKANIKERLGEDALLKEDLQKLAAEKLREHKFFEDSYVFVDSFTDFTGTEEKILEQIIKSADKTTISVNLPARAYDMPHIKSIRETLKTLTSYAKNNYIETVDTIICAKNESDSELARIEKHLWDFSLKAKDIPALPDAHSSTVNMTVCKNSYEEAEYVAIKILEQRAAGVKFSDMAVIMRDAESYKGIINAIFDKYNIPYFISEKTDISTTSAARYILSSLRSVAANLRLDDVLTLVKTGLCPVTSQECDMFEDYCTTWSINGDGFRTSGFNMNPDGYSTRISERGKAILDAANKVRDVIIPPLDAMREKLAVAKNTRESVAAIYDYINETRLSDSVSDLCELELAAGNLRECSEVLRVYDYILDSLSMLSEILGDEKLKVGELISALGIMFAHTDIASVPPIDEYVTIGSASTLRVENIKVAFVMGLCEGEFPRAASEHGIIKERDKDILEELDIKLTSNHEKVSSDELYFVYNALTTPSQKLYLSASSFGIDGRAKAFSFAWNRILFVLGKNKNDIEDFDLSRINNKTADKAADVDERQSNVDPEMTRLVFGDSIRLSKSQISTFTLCPYRYWCENVLGLRESRGSSMNPADIGTLVHYVLEKYLKENKTEEGEIIHRAPEFILDMASQITEKYIDEIGFVPSPSTLYAISRFRNTAYYMLKNIDEEFLESDFKILSLEESISERSYSRLKPMYIDVPVSPDFTPKVILGGTVDRIDVFRYENNAYIRIVDYKTGSDSFSIDKISDGHDIQLPIYLFAVAEDSNKESLLSSRLFADADDGLKIIPASALFFSVREKNGKISPFRSGFILNDDKVLEASNRELKKEFIVGSTKAKNDDGSPGNYLDSEGMDTVKTVLCDTISEIAKNIYSGRAPRCPSSDACGFCKIKNQCPVAVKDKGF